MVELKEPKVVSLTGLWLEAIPGNKEDFEMRVEEVLTTGF